ncbi:hypothetical protein CDAR_539321 [Caerostris darwini]|uniref:Uncharacterized protein n=1 Tax=Caerostris darwini TaxID=1538125 RepID=A0AAV4T1Z1_9ARAC|nr:hypothetical protein CDAR_539321 [Caerostris darwini]
MNAQCHRKWPSLRDKVSRRGGGEGRRAADRLTAALRLAFINRGSGRQSMPPQRIIQEKDNYRGADLFWSSRHVVSKRPSLTPAKGGQKREKLNCCETIVI